MVSVDFKRWVLQGFAVDDSCTDPDQVHTALSALARISGVVEAQRVVCARVLARCSTDPVLDFAAGSRTGRGDASGVSARLCKCRGLIGVPARPGLWKGHDHDIYTAD